MIVPEWLQWTNSIASVLIVIGGAIATLFWKTLVGAFVQEKAKNLATKQDIGEITRATEEVRVQLNLAVQNRLSLDGEQRKAVLDFYINFHYWKSLCEDPSCGVGDNETLESIDQSLRARMIAFRSMDQAYGMFRFFSADATMIDVCWSMVKRTLDLQRLGDNHLYAMKPIVLRLSQQMIPPITEEKVQEHGRLMDQLDTLSTLLSHVTKPVVDEISSLEVAFILHCRQVLYGQTTVRG